MQENCWSQDTTVNKAINNTALSTDTSKIIFADTVKRHNPRLATRYSAMLPGLGQAYNKQYWKAGLVYVGAAVVTGFTVKNYQDYNKYRKIYIGMIDSNPETPNTYNNYTVDDVKFLRDGFRKYLEYSILSAGLGYMINILDAFISAHLTCFDMNKDIMIKHSKNNKYISDF